MALCMALVTWMPFAPLVVALALLGFARAGVIPLLFLEIMGDENIGLSDIGAATGLFFAVGEVGGFSGPYAIGFVADRTDGFTAATLVLTVVALVGATGALVLTGTRASTTP